ncbi:MAG TPA: RNase adapter RapZ [Candidatus Sulfopaludibacter sp.]|nr:RNase adapter RapZ [Candidatus Sulfopaludibacter sp.]
MARKLPSATRRKNAVRKPELVIITGLSGSGKGSVLRSLEDLGFYSVDNLPLELIPKFAELTRDSATIHSAALVVDVREGKGLKRFPEIFESIREAAGARLIFLEADDQSILRRFSETRRPHPLGTDRSVLKSIRSERAQLAPIRALADLVIDTSKFTVHDLREFIGERFRGDNEKAKTMIAVTSFGFRNGVPAESDLVFDVRFLPNPNYIPRFKHLTGKDRGVAQFVRSFPQTREFIKRITDLLTFLLPHYIREGKSYLTISFGCTGGQHRSVMMAAEIGKTLQKAGFQARITHRDIVKAK